MKYYIYDVTYNKGSMGVVKAGSMAEAVKLSYDDKREIIKIERA